MSTTKEELEQILNTPNDFFKTHTQKDGEIRAVLNDEAFILSCPFCGEPVDGKDISDEHRIYHKGKRAMGEIIECPLANQVFPKKYWNNRYSTADEEKLRQAIKWLKEKDK